MWTGRWYQPQGAGQIVATHGATVRLENNDLRVENLTGLQCQIELTTKTAWRDDTRASELLLIHLEVNRG